MKKLTTEDFITKARAVHGDTYSYPDPYINSGTYIRIICPIHGEFFQSPNAHVSQRQGCFQCGREATNAASKKRKPSLEDRLMQFRKVHGDRYDYSLVKYTNAHDNVDIICREHGVFPQTTHSHRKGRGCPKCAVGPQQARNTRRNKTVAEQFVARATLLHKGVFDYTGTVYTHNLNPITFRCIPHNRQLTQIAYNHLDGGNPCPQCNHMKSKDEEALGDMLSIFTSVERRDRQLIKPKELDIYLPEHKLAVEYCGIYYHSHSNAESEKRDKNQHAIKHQACADLGIRLITIFENEYKEHPYAVKRLLRNAIGKSKGKLMARKCEIRKVDIQEARGFYDKYHIQGGAGVGAHYGLYWKDKLVACMRFVFGANDRGTAAQGRCWTLGRYATRVTVSGGASRLFKAFLQEYNPKEVKSFSDNRYFGGGMYKQLGFVLENEITVDYQVWSQKIGIRPKAHYQHRDIPKRLLEHGCTDTYNPETDTRTEKEMTYLMGARRIYDCGKKKWLWSVV